MPVIFLGEKLNDLIMPHPFSSSKLPYPLPPSPVFPLCLKPHEILFFNRNSLMSHPLHLTLSLALEDHTLLTSKGGPCTLLLSTPTGLHLIRNGAGYLKDPKFCPIYKLANYPTTIYKCC